jgi:hypothetical protein
MWKVSLQRSVFIREYVGNQKEKKINKNKGGKHKKEV